MSNRVIDPGAIAKHGAYAHFPGSGPIGETCRRCSHIRKSTANKGRCAKYAELMTLNADKVPLISLNADACKYWERPPRMVHRGIRA